MHPRDIGRRIAHGASARLAFDYECQRANSFSEVYLHGVINEILAAQVSPSQYRIHGGYAHEALRRDAGRGRQREVDFFMRPYDPKGAAVCVEVKWAGSSHASWDNVLLDLCRLELIHEHDRSTECLFVLAGRREACDRLLAELVSNTPIRQHRTGDRFVLNGPSAAAVSKRLGYRLRDWGGRFAGPPDLLDRLPKDSKGRPQVPIKIVSELLESTIDSRGKWQTTVWRVGLFSHPKGL